MNAQQALKLATTGALALFAAKALTAIMGGRGGILTEVAGAAAGVFLASKIQ